ncbi:hypothetical protein PPERSA_09590 [Pseudocohnilembus persalinus]|uniref:Arp2/3 complex 34 kDa subunit n=1 Tax=Pseudocohnilembus persalinus TaxID=266149 RepID=A0A0V0QFS7_PSEPJ|nr:hypothetical protein PPERSA_09590 [Pseudocohnilembus persalinus]|eukprot:KRX00984.1 hypothetical protein PPERSA_09590 [Pseudocohnilembus persalinus]
MMNLSPINPLFKEQIIKIISEEGESKYSYMDYENCKVQFQKNLTNNLLVVSFQCYNFKEIYDAGNKFFIDKDTAENGYDITFEISLNEIQDKKKKQKDMSPEQLEQLQEENNKIKQKNKEIITEISERVAQIKRDFYGSPFENAFQNMKDGKKDQLKNISYSTRQGEKIWIMSDNCDSISILFGFKFSDKVDAMLAKMIIDEMPDSLRLINSPISVKIVPYPEAVIDKFPNADKNKNSFPSGIVSINLDTKQHLKNIEKPTTFLQGFRQYLHYHIHASKSYLHSRLLNRISYFQKQLQTTKFQKDEDKYYRTRKDDNLLIKGDKEEEDNLNKQILKN